jgi:hypothetical protein
MLCKTAGDKRFKNDVLFGRVQQAKHSSNILLCLIPCSWSFWILLQLRDALCCFVVALPGPGHCQTSPDAETVTPNISIKRQDTSIEE